LKRRWSVRFCRYRDPVRADRIAVGEIDDYLDFGIAISSIQDAGGLMRYQRRVALYAVAWDVAFRNGPGT
jgi:hypothetical protein